MLTLKERIARVMSGKAHGAEAREMGRIIRGIDALLDKANAGALISDAEVALLRAARDAELIDYPESALPKPHARSHYRS